MTANLRTSFGFRIFFAAFFEERWKWLVEGAHFLIYISARWSSIALMFSNRLLLQMSDDQSPCVPEEASGFMPGGGSIGKS